MDHLWTPWRYQYISSMAGKQQRCILCDALERDPAEALVVHRGATCFLILNRYPYSNGHLMVATVRHIGTLAEARPEELHELMDWAQRSEQALHELYHPEGFNIGINLGRCAGAGVVGHLHVHVVPRWAGDASFVSVVGETRVLAEELPTTHSRLTEYFKRTNIP